MNFGKTGHGRPLESMKSTVLMGGYIITVTACIAANLRVLQSICVRGDEKVDFENAKNIELNS